MSDANIRESPETQKSIATVEDLQNNLKSYFQLVDQSRRFSDLLEKTERFKQMVPAALLQRVQEEYREKKKGIDQQLEEEKGKLKTIYGKYLKEKQRLQEGSSRLAERLREIQFRHIVGEYRRGDIEDECKKLRTSLLEHTRRLGQLEDSLHLLFGVDLPDLGLQENGEIPGTLPSIPETHSKQDDHSFNNQSFPTVSPPHLVTVGRLGKLAATSEEFKNEYDDAARHKREQTTNSAAQPPSDAEGYLIALDGNVRGRRFSLPEGDITLGSAPGSDIVLKDAGITGTHARIRYKDDKYYLENCDKLNRCYVNGLQCETIELKKSDLIKIGEVTFRMAFSRTPQ